ncbi:hypothetical protein G9X67_34755 [Rhizobium sp. WYCCWR 11152]|uniref:hypothetical protein n=1 Tax=Rhizobium sp. WYCCWR 11152 TaxID=2692316 RepID=UPI0014928BB4|nr:hypothetical protein [Rhizobium sp. WYCCWR 11152]NNU70414.1 hypothetical protein [Rhizobium sp. WYCCWR 11152]
MTLIKAEEVLDSFLFLDGKTDGGTEGMRASAINAIANAILAERRSFFKTINRYKDEIDWLLIERQNLRDAMFKPQMASGHYEEADFSVWFPIETAPKDGTVVDLWNSKFKHRQVNCRWLLGAEVDPVNCGEDGQWHHLRMDGWRDAGDRANGCGCLSPDQFTHWMPLPTPPSTTTPQERSQESAA